MSCIYYNMQVGTFESADHVLMCAVFVSSKEAGSSRDPQTTCHFFGAVEDVAGWAKDFVTDILGETVRFDGFPCTEDFMLNELRFAFQHACRLGDQPVRFRTDDDQVINLSLSQAPAILSALDPAVLISNRTLTDEPCPLGVPLAA